MKQHVRMPLKSLFPSLICTKKLGLAPKFLRELRDESLLICEKDGEGLAWSEKNYPRGFTSYGSLDQLHRFSSSFESLRTKIDPQVSSFGKSLGFKLKKNQLQLTRMWVNVMGEGCSHAQHIHPLSVISGTLYIETPPGSSVIKFEDPRLSSFMARPLARLPYFSYSPQSGDLVLFESWMRHEVPPHRGPKRRISVSFNYDWVGV